MKKGARKKREKAFLRVLEKPGFAVDSVHSVQFWVWSLRLELDYIVVIENITLIFPLSPFSLCSM